MVRVGASQGWYDDGSGRQRWWDGNQWTEHYSDTPELSTAAPGTPSPDKKKKKWGRTPKIVLGSVGALVAGVVMIAVFAPGGGDEPADAEDVVATAPADPTPAPAAPETDAAPTPAPDPTTPPAQEQTTPPTQEDLSAPDDSTPSQRQALAAALNYLDTDMGFSRAGLIQQLSSEYGNGFSVEDATWAVDHAEADWNAQAVTAAQVYLNTGMGFSRASLIEQLTSEYGSQFTQEQAQHAADAVGL